MRLYILIISLVIFLSGCQSYIAYQITKPPEKFGSTEYQNSILSSGTQIQYCDSENDCLDFRFISPKDIESYLLDGNTLSLSFIIERSTEDDVFEYQLTSDNLPNNPNNGLLIIFPGYGVNSLIYTMQARWLSHVTGKNVIVMPASNQYEKFRFGLNSLDLLINYVNKENYTDISLISYSMGAVASTDLTTKLNINKHILYAPMINFEAALITIANLSHPIYSKLLGDDYLNEVAAKIIEKSEVPLNKLNLLNNLNNLNKTPHARQTYIFSSNADKVSPYNRLLALNNPKVSIYEVKDLNHLEMVSLISSQQRNVLLSLLDG
ncbi:alpha/beta hydrolase [Pseudoalteromonas espejiana]